MIKLFLHQLELLWISVYTVISPMVWHNSQCFRQGSLLTPTTTNISIFLGVILASFLFLPLWPSRPVDSPFETYPNRSISPLLHSYHYNPSHYSHLHYWSGLLCGLRAPSSAPQSNHHSYSDLFKNINTIALLFF